MKIIPQRQKIPRIVFVDDEEWLQEMVELVLRNYFNEVSLLKFRNRDEAWQELLREEPDLLITDLRNDNVPTLPGSTKENLGMSGFDLLHLLAARQVKYPILVVSGCLSISGMEGLAKKWAGPNLKVSYLTKPFTTELFYQGLFKCLVQVPTRTSRFDGQVNSYFIRRSILSTI